MQNLYYLLLQQRNTIVTSQAKRDFRNAVKLQYDWPVGDIPSTSPRVQAGNSLR